ncbi:MAG: ABC transporter permease, partial [Oscillospiraceae bacterium]|nr:ABC transporter permease [Oscillospiraceae bacterium]
NFSSISSETAETITARLREFPDTTIFGAGSNVGSTWSHTVPIPEDMLTRSMREHVDPEHQREELNLSIALVTVDAEHYAELCRLAGVPFGSNILINHFRQRVDDHWTEFTPIVWNGQTLRIPYMDQTDADALHELTLHGELSGADVPNEILHVSRAMLTVVVPRLDAGTYSWFADTANPHGFTEHMFEVFDELIPRDGDIHVNTGVRNIAAEQSSERSIVRLVMVFTYGFVGMLTLIGLTNVISTISTNVRSRSREFAVLRSVGMTHGGVKRMLNLESIMCSVKSLVVGLPLGVIASYLIYQAVMISVDFPYKFPWPAIVQSVLGVFAVTWITMRYSASRLRGGNIVESIRNETV